MPNQFTENELKFLAANAMGRSSEAGSLAVMKLGLAIPNANLSTSNGVTTVSYPSGNNSGYTVGFFQWDFGAKRNAREMIDAYNEWAGDDKKIPAADIDSVVQRLEQNRDHGPAQRIDLRNEALGRNFNEFLASDKGYEFVMGLQAKQYDDALSPAMQRALQSPAVQNMSREDAQIVLAAVSKVTNQRGSVQNSVWTMLENEKTPATKDQILGQIYAVSSKWVVQGVQHTVQGAELNNKLAADQGILGDIYREKVQQDPMSVPNFGTDPKEQMLDALFRNPAQANKLLDAVSQGKDYIVNTSNQTRNEAYTVGVKNGELFTIDKDGQGYRLKDGEWQAFNNQELQLLHGQNNKWQLEAPVLARGSKGPEVKELQEKLMAAGFLPENHNAIQNFGPVTEKALRAFQEQQGIPVNGKYDSATREQLNNAVQSQSSQISPEVQTLQENLRTGLIDKINGAGAGKFADAMIAETTYACVKAGITADKLGQMDINVDQNRIVVAAKGSTTFASVDAFAAAKTNPEERLHDASQLQEQMSQQQTQQTQQLAQQQQHASPTRV